MLSSRVLGTLALVYGLWGVNPPGIIALISAPLSAIEHAIGLGISLAFIVSGVLLIAQKQVGRILLVVAAFASFGVTLQLTAMVFWRQEQIGWEGAPLIAVPLLIDFALLVLIIYLARNVRFQSRTQVAASDAPQHHSAGILRPVVLVAQRLLALGSLFWGIVVVGALLPWVVGLWVWFDLQRQGKPVLQPEPYFNTPSATLTTIGLMAYASLIFSIAPVLVGLVTRHLWVRRAASPSPTAGKRAWMMVTGGLAGALLWSVYVYSGIWQDAGSLMMFMILMPVLPAMVQMIGPLAGWGVGYLVYYLLYGARERRQAQHPG